MSVLGFVARLPSSVLKLCHIIRKVNPDVVHTNTSLIISSGFAAKICRRPHVWHVRESFGEFGRIWKYYRTLIQRFSDVVICVSTPIAQQFALERKNCRVVVLHNGIPREEFDGVTLERIEEFKRAHELCGHPLVGVIGRIKIRRKGQEVFLKAAAILKEHFPEVRFLLIGSPFPGNESHLEAVLKLSGDLGLADRLVYTGDVEDIKAAHSALDVSVLPSVSPEPFGGVVLEAMALSRAVVGTRTGGTVEQIDHEVTGLLVQPDDAADMASAIRRLLEDEKLRDEMGRNGRERFLSRFEFERFYSRILSIYHDLPKCPR